MAVLDHIKSKLFSGHERSVRAKKNILALAGLKGYSVAVSLALIPLTLKLLDEYQYGVWITLFNVLSWISIFDIGIGNGLRNKFAEAMAKNRIEEAREYVSTAYFLMFGISISLILIFIIPWIIVDWIKVFNVPSEFGNDIFFLVGITFLLTSFQFCLKLIDTLLTANHKPAWSALMGTISNTLILLLLWLGKDMVNDSLFAVGFIYTGVPLLVFLLSSLYFFSNQFKSVSPKISFFRKSKVKSLFSLGMQFFIIQIAVVVIFSTDSMIITHMLSPKEVTPYSIVFRYFSVVTMAAGIIMTPLWSAYTEAAAKGDLQWIRNILKKQLILFSFLVVVVFILYMFGRPLIKLWLKNDIVFSNHLFMGMALYTILSLWNNIFSFFLGGLSLVRLGTFLTTITALLNIPLSIYFIKVFDNDVGGVIYATAVCIGITAIVSPIQTWYFLFAKTKTNFLNKLLR